MGYCAEVFEVLPQKANELNKEKIKESQWMPESTNT
jgi:hypothetical protein